MSIINYFFSVQGTVLAAVEALSETALLFYGWIILPPEISLLLMNGMFSVQAIWNFIKLCKYGICTSSYENIDTLPPRWLSSTRGYCRLLVVIVLIIGLLMQFAGLTLACVFAGLASIGPEVITIAVCTLMLSLAWSDRIQRLVTIPNLSSLGKRFKQYAEKHNYQPAARWKSSKYVIATYENVLIGIMKV